MKTEEELLNRMQAYCARTEHCRSEVAAKLRQAGADDRMIEQVLQRLVDDRFIDEERFARAYARDKYRFNGWGPKRIALELTKRHIPDSIITSALSDLEEGEDKIEDSLTRLLKRKLRSIKDTDDRSCLHRLVRWAVGRGFEYEQVMKEALRLIRKGYEEDD
ncbi:recombinase RecX [Porphyromonas gulae]|uniref:regulatory protein RecX n=1 Tax=Porphyromonas gulae TaxID=111105 RepID=UPI00052C65C4|nr:regulatory protein RecX [Porphyromonas gulae]KGN72683.1 recombinase RecX [Porphyromonas gulae]KGO04087.1 recombinase RecX [Porphyromonas gulae]